MNSLPKRPLTNLDLERYTSGLANFRGIFMRDALPKTPRRNECGILNMDNSKGPGSHWTAYRKEGSNVVYFDSYGNLQPPKEIVKYFYGNHIYYNHDNYQATNPYNCGHLSLKFLFNKLK